MYDVKVIAYNDGCVDTLIAKKAVTVYDKSFIRYPNAFAPSDASPEDGSYPVRITSYNVCYTKLLRTIIVFIFLQRYIVSALTAGSVKG